MFSWGGCVIKLLISVALACATGNSQENDQEILARIVMGVLIYSIISAWWYCCCLAGNYIIGSILFFVVVGVATWGGKPGTQYCAENHFRGCADSCSAGRCHSGHQGDDRQHPVQSIEDVFSIGGASDGRQSVSENP